MHRLLSNAENALNGRPRTATESYGEFRQSTPSLAARLQQSPVMQQPYAGGNVVVSDAALMHSDVTRQLAVCMSEVRELRHELALEREARSSVLAAFAKRIKEEVLGDVRSTEHHLQRSIREMEAEFGQRLTEQDNARALMKRSVDDALRQIKTQDRSSFDAQEIFREEVESMRQRVDQSVSVCQQLRAEMSQRFEKEAAAHTHRLDVELMRYADMQRQQQQSLTETRQAVATEVAQVSQTVSKLVEDCWTRRIDVVSRSIQDAVDGFRKQQERHSQVVADLSAKTTQFTRDVRQELNLATQDLRDRIIAAEGALPVLTSRVDRFERKADHVFETANKLTAQFEALQESCDKISVLAAKSIERSQKIEDTSAERDDRILRCESQLSGLAGLDRLKVDIEGLRRGLSRVESMMDSVKQTADRDERLVETMQRNIDASLERADAVEKKAHKVVARVETAEQRLLGFVDRIIKLEDEAEKNSNAVEASSSAQGLVEQRMISLDHRLRALGDKSDVSVKELQERLHTVEVRAEAAWDAAGRSDNTSSGYKKELERLEKRIAKCEAGGSNVVDNVRETRDIAEQVQRDHVTMQKKLDQWKEVLERKTAALDSKMLEFDSTGASLGERFARNDKRTASMIENLEKRLEDRIEMVAKRTDELQSAAARRATQDAVGSGARAASVVDETLAVEVGAARRRLDGIESRVRQLEAKSTAESEDFVHRHELLSVKALIGSTEASMKHSLSSLQQSLASLQQRPMVAAHVSAPPVQHPVTPSTAAWTLSEGGTATAAASQSVPARLSAVTTAAAQRRVDTALPTVAASHPEPTSPTATTVSTLHEEVAADRRHGAARSDRMSSVSSLHGAAPHPVEPSYYSEDSDEMERLRRTRAAATATSGTPEAAVTTSGLPPLASGVMRNDSNLGLGPSALAVTKAPLEKKRSPYSDTSESERERASSPPPTKLAPPVAVAASAPVVLLSEPQPLAKAPAPKIAAASIAADFDDDDEDNDEFEIADDMAPSLGSTSALRAQSVRSENTFVMDEPKDTEAPEEGKPRRQSPLPVSLSSTALLSSRTDARAGAETTDDDLGLPLGRPVSQRRGFVSAGDSSSAAEALGPTNASTAEEVVQPKKFHAAAMQKKKSTDFDNESDDDDEELRSSTSPRDGGSQARSRTSRRSAQSRRTTDVSLSLNSSRKNASSRRRGEDTVEDIEDDDQLAEMLGFIDAKRRK